MNFAHRLNRVLLLCALTVALAAIGFGHRLPTSQDEAMALALANGATLADFCGDVDGDGHPDPHCLACQITATSAVPVATPAQIDLELAYHAQVIAPREIRALSRVLDPSNTPQGPPAA
ncbi:MAG: hypothetical protein MUE52_10240 [Tabrizicola sp.]|nr:hypothetical protein [Tabrizicola sp.]